MTKLGFPQEVTDQIKIIVDRNGEDKVRRLITEFDNTDIESEEENLELALEVFLDSMGCLNNQQEFDVLSQEGGPLAVCSSKELWGFMDMFKEYLGLPID